jgi:molybdate transport system ATP-binding protein
MTLELRVAGTRPDFRFDFRCELPTRGITAVFGRSGAGKTTLLRAIAGLERIPGAELRFEDSVWQDARRFVPPHRRAIGYVFQEPSLFPHLDVRGNLEFGLRRRRPEARRLTLEEGVALLDLESLLSRRPQALSGGERQRVAIARALLASPRLLLLDEPLSSLDTDARATILGHLERLRERLEIPMIYVTHALREVMQLADHLLLIETGEVRAAGSLQALLTRADLPFVGFEESGSVLDAVLEAQEREFHLSRVRIAAGTLWVSLRELPPGAKLRVRIEARDVSITLDPPLRTSITNVLPARVLDLKPDRDPARMWLRLALGPDVLLACITRRSAVGLGLARGMPVYAQIKSAALMNEHAGDRFTPEPPTR